MNKAELLAWMIHCRKIIDDGLAQADTAYRKADWKGVRDGAAYAQGGAAGLRSAASQLMDKEKT